MLCAVSLAQILHIDLALRSKMFMIRNAPHSSGREPMASEPDVALLMSASDSLSRRQIFADFL